MRSRPERQMRLLRPEDVEAVRIGKAAVVAVRSADAEPDLKAFRKRHAGELDRAGDAAWVHADRRDPAHRFLERGWPQLRPGQNALLLRRVLQQAEDEREDGVARLVQPAADDHLDVGADALDRHWR